MTQFTRYSCLMLAALLALVAGCELNDDTGSDDGSNHVTLIPESMTLDSDATSTAVFTASGGTPPYTWTLSDTNGTMGALSAQDDMAVYTPTAAAGGVYVTVQDAAGESATAAIVQN